MKKLFGGKSKTKASKEVAATDVSEPPPVPTPIHAKLATTLTKPSPPQKQRHVDDSNKQLAHSPAEDEDRWEVVQPYPDAKPLPQILPPSRSSSYSSIPPALSPSIPPRPSSPATAPIKASRPQQQPNDSRKKHGPTAPVALGILKALEPPRSSDQTPIHQHAPRSHSDERFMSPDRTSISDPSHLPRDERKEKRGFWNKDKDKERRDNPPQPPEQRARKEHDEPSQDLTRRIGELDPYPQVFVPRNITDAIGYLTATASEDFSLVYDVCDRASASDASAKEAVRALRREFKYGEPPAQLSAARLWAIMLHNSTPTFVSQSRSRKFLETLEELLTSPRTNPVVRERLLDVIAAAAYATRHHPRPDEFRTLWRRVKPVDKPDEGIPFDTEDPMFNPAPALPSRTSQYEAPHSAQPSPVQPREPTSRTPPPAVNPPRRRKSPTRNRIIPLEEDIRRLLQECKIGQGNASLLSQALSLCKPEDVHKSEIINEFYLKCHSSQELVFAQIPWATTQAERSRDQETVRQRASSNDSLRVVKPRIDETIEEKLLASLLASNGELVEALRQFDDLVRIAEEKRAEDRSRKEVRMDRRDLISRGENIGDSNSRSPSPSRSYSPSYGSTFSHSRAQHHNNHIHNNQGEFDGDHTHTSSLAPPPIAPHGPRSPGQLSVRSRTPSSSIGSLHDLQQHHIPNGSSNGYNNYHRDEERHTYQSYEHSEFGSFYEDEDGTPSRPSAKALGKRKVIDSGSPEAPVHADDPYFDDQDQTTLDDRFDSDSESLDGQSLWLHQPVNYVYDAAAERTQQRLQEVAPINGVH